MRPPRFAGFGMFQDAPIGPDGGQGYRKTAAIIAHLEALSGRWTTCGILPPSLAGGMRHDGPGASVETCVPGLVPHVDVRQASIDAPGLDKQRRDAHQPPSRCTPGRGCTWLSTRASRVSTMASRCATVATGDRSARDGCVPAFQSARNRCAKMSCWSSVMSGIKLLLLLQ